MAYDANGVWKAENDSVQSRLSGVLAKGSPIMQQARTSAKQYANKRGLLNSTMAASCPANHIFPFFVHGWVSSGA